MTGSTLNVAVDACGADATGVTAEEESGVVILEATTTGSTTDAECADTAEVVLSRPLGNRQVIDGLTGNVLSPNQG